MFQKIINMVLNFFDTEEKKVTYNVIDTEYKDVESEEVINSYYKLEPDENSFYRTEEKLKAMKSKINKIALPYNKLSEDLITTLKSYHGVEHQILWNVDVDGTKIECIFITPFKIFLFGTKYINCDTIKRTSDDMWEYHYGRTIHNEENPILINNKKREVLSKFLNVKEDYIDPILIFVSTGVMEEELFNDNLVFLNQDRVNMLKSLLFFKIEEEHILTFNNEQLLEYTEKLYECIEQ